MHHLYIYRYTFLVFTEGNLSNIQNLYTSKYIKIQKLCGALYRIERSISIGQLCGSCLAFDTVRQVRRPTFVG